MALAIINFKNVLHDLELWGYHLRLPVHYHLHLPLSHHHLVQETRCSWSLDPVTVKLTARNRTLRSLVGTHPVFAELCFTWGRLQLCPCLIMHLIYHLDFWTLLSITHLHCSSSLVSVGCTCVDEATTPPCSCCTVPFSDWKQVFSSNGIELQIASNWR